MNTILLSFDTEEFDVSKEHGVPFSLDEGIAVSVVGTNRILDILQRQGVKATFFCTGNFITHAPDTVQRIIREGHEVACHGVDHWHPQPTDFARSKEIMETATGLKAYGYRQPRMFTVDDEAIEKAGYLYNTSLNPAFIPGRYMHLTTPRTFFMKGNVLQIPASVTPWLRIPLFWLALHNFPQWLYRAFVRLVLRHDGYFATYFHPWEFFELKEHPEWKMPFIIKNHSGLQMVERLDKFIFDMKSDGCCFTTYKNFAMDKIASLTGG